MSARDVMTTDEQTKFIPVADAAGHPFSLCAYLMLYAGLRVSELGRLAWVDLYVNQEPVKAIALQAQMCKNHHSRTVPVARPLADKIRRTWRYHARDRGYTPASYATARSFRSVGVDVRTIQRRIQAMGRKAFSRPITPHTLRHTFATRMIAVTSTRVVQQLMGHRRIQTTELYTHINGADLAAAMEKIQ